VHFEDGIVQVMSFFAALLWALVGLVSGLATPVAEQAGVSGQVTVALGRPGAAARPGDPPILGSKNPARPLVVIDPGHGGRDGGATSVHDGSPEKDIVLEIARAVRDELIRSNRVRVALTRDEDRFIELRERYEIARRLGADLFISIHADAAPLNDLARGATIYTLSEVASDREAALLAQRENRSDIIGGVDLGGRDAAVNLILIDLAQRESMDVSTDFARLLQREGAPLFPFRPEPHRFASLVVLKAPDVPSILFESGYLTNVEDSRYLGSPEGRTQIATGMRRAIEAHFARRRVQIATR
jgi:N-acetylmuramoyl-L-alanine amidase